MRGTRVADGRRRLEGRAEVGMTLFLVPSHGVVGDQRAELRLDLVRRIARRVARRLPSWVELADLEGAGAEGLLHAAASFDPARGENFEAYAARRIRGAMLDELRAADPVTRHGRRRMRAIRRAVADLEQMLGRQPDDVEIAQRLAIPLAEYRRVALETSQAPTRSTVEVDADRVPGPTQDPHELCVAAELRDSLARAIAALPTRTQEILALYYQEDVTQAEIGRALGVTESRVCQILRDAHARLRASLDDNDAGLAASALRRSA